MNSETVSHRKETAEIVTVKIRKSEFFSSCLVFVAALSFLSIVEKEAFVVKHSNEKQRSRQKKSSGNLPTFE